MATQPQTLSGKTAIITGGTRGIGAATVLELAKRGAKVAFTYVSNNSAKLAAEIIDTINDLGNGSSAIAIQADIGNPDSVDKIVKESVAALGDRIDILIHNAAATAYTPVGSVSFDDYEKILNVNLRGTIFLTQAVVPYLPKAGGGRIITIGSTVSRKPIHGTAVYAATKAGLEALSRVWALELGPSGHTVNTIAPGSTDTEALAATAETNEDIVKFLQQVKEITPMENRLGTAEDIALVIAMIAEPQARWITGQSISASGGLAMF